VVRARVTKTLGDLGDLGHKRAGTPEGRKAGDYVMARLAAAGLADVRAESFRFGKCDIVSSSLAVTIDGVAVPMDHEVFAYSGSGTAEGSVVYVGSGAEADYQGKDAAGKIVLLERSPTFHRTSQYRLVHEKGGAAMLYVSTAPENLIQIGIVREADEGLGPIPTATVGQDDGAKLITAAKLGRPVHVAISGDLRITAAEGQNILGYLPGTDPTASYVLVGAHYDTWQVGSADNGTGVAAMLELADTLAAAPRRRYGTLFVGYDAEEIGMLGGYDFLRTHVVLAKEPMLAWVNLEIPVTTEGASSLLGVTHGAGLDPAFADTLAHSVYPLVAGMEVIPTVSGGIIPTDIQGMYWYGLPGMTTVANPRYYHTKRDVPDTVDTDALAASALAFRQVLDFMDRKPIADYAVHDEEVWRIEATSQPAGAALAVTAGVRDGKGAPVAGAMVSMFLTVDDFTRVLDASGTTDAAGVATFGVPADALAKGSGGRWLHLRAGREHPLAEWIAPIGAPP
jgi:Iap family predicted aminopeptidase